MSAVYGIFSHLQVPTQPGALPVQSAQESANFPDILRLDALRRRCLRSSGNGSFPSGMAPMLSCIGSTGTRSCCSQSAMDAKQATRIRRASLLVRRVPSRVAESLRVGNVVMGRSGQVE